jgi:hypothetical protein
MAIIRRVLDSLLMLALLASTATLGYSYFAAPQKTAAATTEKLRSAAEQMRGTAPPPVVIYGRGDQPDTLRIDSLQRTLIIVFRSDCRFCEATAPTWSKLSKELSPGSSLVAVNTEDPATAEHWVQRHGISAAQLAVPIDIQKFLTSWSIIGVPITAVVSGGRFAYVHFGVLGDDDVSVLQDALIRRNP